MGHRVSPLLSVTPYRSLSSDLLIRDKAGGAIGAGLLIYSQPAAPP